MFSTYKLTNLETGEVIIDRLPNLKKIFNLDSTHTCRLQWCANENLTFSIRDDKFKVERVTIRREV